jgi:hypothetical protein
VTSEKPQLSADIANFQIEEINKYRASVFENNRTNDYNNVKLEFDNVSAELQLLEDSIYSIKGGKTDLLFNFFENLDNENYDAAAFVDDPRLEKLIRTYQFKFYKFKELRVSHDKKKQQLGEILPSVYVVDRAVPSHQKVGPSFILNGAIGAFLLFFIVLTTRLFIDKWTLMRKEVDA